MSNSPNAVRRYPSNSSPTPQSADRNPRRTLSYPASVMLGADGLRQSCKIIDISKSGAHLLIGGADQAPPEIYLFVSEHSTHGRCGQIVWKTEFEMGIRFLPKKDREFLHGDFAVVD